MNRILQISLSVTLVIGVWALFNSCKKVNIVTTTTKDVNIVDYLRQKPDEFSSIVQILDKTDISSYLNAYGAYTFFVPTNDAIKNYLTETGKASIDALTVDELKQMVRLHLIQDTLRTTDFDDGKMPRITMYGQYLITGAANISGVTRTIVNRRALITVPNISLANGVVHIIDKVLLPATKTTAQIIEADTRYSIFTQALKATGYYDTLNVITNDTASRYKWLTVLAQSDSVFNSVGINSFDDLKAKYSNTGNPLNTADSLHLYMGYHILYDIKYLADIISAPSHPTLAPLEVVTAKLVGSNVLINDDIFNGIAEPGIGLNRLASDNSAINGVVHDATNNIYLKLRRPTPVYFDIADQPELRAITSVFRKAAKSVAIAYGQLKDVTWDRTASTITYTCDATTTTNFHYWDDYLVFGLRLGNSAVVNWIEFTTPMLVKGKYKVWICFRRGGHGLYTQVSFDGQPLSRIVNLTDFIQTGAVDENLFDSLGYKRYSNSPITNSTQMAKLAGTIEVTTTDRHKIRLQAIRDFGSGASGVTLDMIHFIPVDIDQLYPKFNRDGSVTPRP